jgi:hypothetical protein
MDANALPMSSLSVEVSSQPLSIALQSLIAQLQEKIGDGQVDEISLSREDGLELIQQLQRASDVVVNPPSDPQLVRAATELKTLKAFIRLGDYAGTIFNDLKTSDHGYLLREHANKLASKLVKAFVDKKSELWNSFALSCANPRPGLPVEQDVALFAIQKYGARNDVCHSEFAQCKVNKDWDALAQHIHNDLAELTDILPDDDVQDRDNWRMVIESYRDQTIEETAPNSGKWYAKQAPQLVESNDRPEATDRRIFDLRKLPKQVREHAFENGREEKDSLPVGTSRVSGRRILVRSDPPPGSKRKVSDLLDLGLPKKSCKTKGMESTRDVSHSQPVEKDSFDVLVADLVKDLHGVADKDTVIQATEARLVNPLTSTSLTSRSRVISTLGRCNRKYSIV